MSFDAFAEFRMNGHNVIITGGAQNIGAGIAKTLSGAGAKVMIADLNGDMAARTAAEVAKETGNDCRGMACDVTDRAQIDAVVKATVDAFGGISTLINNVGWGGRQDDPAAIPEEEFLNSYKLNTISAYRMSMACLPHLEKAENATITNSGSFSSAVPAYDILPYATAKAAPEPDDGLARPPAEQAGPGELHPDRERDHRGLCQRRDHAGDAGADDASRQSDRASGPPAGYRQRDALALFSGRRLGQRADDQRPWRR